MGRILVGKENGQDIHLYFKDWGSGQPIVFSHGWPLSADAWEDQIRNQVLSDRSQFFKELSVPFYGANRDYSSVSQGLRDGFWLQGMLAGFNAIYECIRAFSETDFTEDLKKMDIPTLILHGDDDQIVPIDNSSKLSAQAIKKSKLKIYNGAPHGMCSTHKNQVNADLLSFIHKF